MNALIMREISIGIFKSRLNDKVLQKNIWESYPKSSIKRRNTGYALDAILGSAVFTPEGDAINLCKIICGSEGTFGVISENHIELGTRNRREMKY